MDIALSVGELAEEEGAIFVGEPEQTIGCRRDVLDRGTRLCLEERDRINQQRLIWNEPSRGLQFGQHRTRPMQAFSTSLVSIPVAAGEPIAESAIRLKRHAATAFSG